VQQVAPHEFQDIEPLFNEYKDFKFHEGQFVAHNVDLFSSILEDKSQFFY